MTLRNAKPAGTVDHFCIALSDFNKEVVTQQLKAQGVVPIDELTRNVATAAVNVRLRVIRPHGVEAIPVRERLMLNERTIRALVLFVVISAAIVRTWNSFASTWRLWCW
jgi:hypothetical protein